MGVPKLRVPGPLVHYTFSYRINTSRVKTRLLKILQLLILRKLFAKTTTAVNNFQNTLYLRFLILNIPGIWICGVEQSSEYAWICQNILAFVLFRHCNPLFPWTCDYLFQCLCETSSYSFKEYEVAFFEETKIWFFYNGKYLIWLF